jgi:putative Holliday junction resolvase
MTRWLGIDHGTRRMGMAVADSLTAIASPLSQLPAQPLEQCLRQILVAAADYSADGIVVGWPLNDDGSEGPQANLARQFALQLAGRTTLPVRLWDEHLSSFAADQKLRGLYTRKQKKQRHDSLAAAAFLEDFLRVGGPFSAPLAQEVKPG